MDTQTIEGNVLIAIFDGKIKDEDSLWWRGFDFKQTHGYVSVHQDNLQYHSSWDWIMPVVEKIESLGYKVRMCRKRVEIVSDNVVVIPGDIFIMQKEETKKKSTWLACKNFIEYYNTTNP